MVGSILLDDRPFDRVAQRSVQNAMYMPDCPARQAGRDRVSPLIVLFNAPPFAKELGIQFVEVDRPQLLYLNLAKVGTNLFVDEPAIALKRLGRHVGGRPIALPPIQKFRNCGLRRIDIAAGVSSHE